MIRGLLQGITALFILASLILQILVILGNFNGLKNVNILKVDLSNPGNTSDGGLFDGVFNTVKNTLDDNVIPNYLTMSLFKVCEGLNSGENCSPPSFGFRYSSTGLLNTIENGIPESVHNTLTGVQGGVFLPSVILCFLLLCYQFIHAFSYRNGGCCGLVMIFTLAIIAFIFSVATFIVQIVAYNEIKDAINNLKGSIFGGLFSTIVEISTHTGASVGMSLAAFILLFFVCVFLALSICCLGDRRNRDKKEEEGWFARKRTRRREEYEMGRVF